MKSVVSYLEYSINKNDTGKSKCEPVKNAPVRTTVSELNTFLMPTVFNFYGRFLKKENSRFFCFLYKLLSKNIELNWSGGF